MQILLTYAATAVHLFSLHLRLPHRKKKKNKGAIIGIVAAVLIVLAIIGSTSEKIFQQQGYGDSDNVEITTRNSINLDDDVAINDDYTPSVVYTKGTFANGVYTNEWANMNFVATSDWVNADDSQYALLDSTPGAEYGLILDNDINSSQLQIIFYSGTVANLTEEEFLDSSIEGMEEAYKSQNLTTSVSSAYETTIAGKTFTAQTISCAESPVTMITCIHFIDNYAHQAVVSAQSYADASMILNSITTVS